MAASASGSGSTSSSEYKSSLLSNPWLQLASGVVCMAMVANLQYGWTIFVNPIDAKYQWGKTAIQVAFTIFVLFETWLVPFEAYLADRLGPRPLVVVGAFLVAASWIIYSRADTLTMLYTGGAIGGIGTGLVYGTCIGNAVKWFNERRGLAAGLTAAGFGAGAAITVIPLTRSLASRGYEATFFNFALLQGAVILVAALFLQKPPKTAVVRRPNPRLIQTTVDSTPLQTIRSVIFWILYVDFVLVAASGLMVTAQLAPIANGYGIATSPVNFLGYSVPALLFALSLNNLMNGLGRPLFGAISDIIGREVMLTCTLVTEALTILLLGTYGGNPLIFVCLAALSFLVWGDIYSIFPGAHLGPVWQKVRFHKLCVAVYRQGLCSSVRAFRQHARRQYRKLVCNADGGRICQRRGRSAHVFCGASDAG